MSRPDPPKSGLGGRKSEARLLLDLALIVVAGWEAVYLVLLLSGQGPQGQIWSVPGRWMAWWTRSVQHLPPPGGWLWATWGVGSIAWVPLCTMAVLLLLAAYLAVLVHERHGLPSLSLPRRRERPPKGPRNGNGRGSSRSKGPASDQPNLSMEEWLEREQAGHGEGD